ncbi:hypothetical protein KA183_09590 [bacterium]|nr:hypothetical protein [bacterium]QQR56454.1 MAG: hypothetical protein IPG59_15770 [Candidatus Melainabacteria bacterium]
MSPAGPKGRKRKKNPGAPPPSNRGGRSASAASEDDDEMAVDAASGNEKKKDLPKAKAKRSKNEANKEMWNQGKKGLSDIWENYVQMLRRDFQKRPRDSQEQLILRLSQVLTIGCVVVLLNFFYSFIPSVIRIFAFPVLLVIAWFVATRAIAPMIVVRFEDHLNPREKYEDDDEDEDT